MLNDRFADLDFLIVDDDEFARMMVFRMLRRLGIHRIHQASTGFEGLGKLRYPHHADVVILDFNMPLMNGLEMLRKIRDGSAGVDRAKRVMMLTGHADPALVATAAALDTHAFMVKPISADTLSTRLDTALEIEVDPKTAEEYAAVEIPRTARFSNGTGPRNERPTVAETFDERGIPMRLENVPAGARLTEEVWGPDGDLLLPAGVRLTEKLLERLSDLRTYDDCVARLRVDLKLS